ncbi:unnamed protein product [Mucor fragilis]
MEAEFLGIPTDTIKKGVGWKDCLGRLETHYLGKVPSEFARSIAGFWNKLFGLKRNRINPLIELQQEVFPWIENCFEEMNQTDENEFYEGDLEAEFIAETVEENDSNQLTLAKRKQKQKQV